MVMRPRCSQDSAGGLELGIGGGNVGFGGMVKHAMVSFSPELLEQLLQLYILYVLLLA